MVAVGVLEIVAEGRHAVRVEGLLLRANADALAFCEDCIDGVAVFLEERLFDVVGVVAKKSAEESDELLVYFLLVP